MILWFRYIDEISKLIQLNFPGFRAYFSKSQVDRYRSPVSDKMATIVLPASAPPLPFLLSKNACQDIFSIIFMGLTMTLRYAHLSEARLKDVAKALGAAVAGCRTWSAGEGFWSIRQA